MLSKTPIDKIRVLMLGANRLSAKVAEMLLSAGFRRIVINDSGDVRPDDMDSRYFLDSDIFRKKRSSAIAERIEKPDGTHMVATATPVRSMDSWNYDIYLGCSCSSYERLIINSHARQYDIPYVDGVISGDLGRVQVVGNYGPCLECILHRPSLAHPIPGCGSIDAVAGQMVSEAIAAVSVGPSACSRGAIYFEDSGDAVRIDLGVSSICPHHKKFEA